MRSPVRSRSGPPNLFPARNGTQVVENRECCTGSNKLLPVEANSVRKEHLLQALLLSERGPRDVVTCDDVTLSTVEPTQLGARSWLERATSERGPQGGSARGGERTETARSTNGNTTAAVRRQRRGLDARKSAESESLHVVPAKECDGVVNLRRKLVEIGFARQHVHARRAVSPPIRLAPWKHWLAPMLYGAHGQGAMREKRFHIEVGPVHSDDC